MTAAKLCIVITADTRRNSSPESSTVGEDGEGSLHGCRSPDFLVDTVKMAHRFFEGYDKEILLYVDQHEAIPLETMRQIEGMLYDGTLTKLTCAPHDRTKHRWYDQIYISALSQAHRGVSQVPTHIVKLDQDCAIFRRPESDIVEKYLTWLDNGFSYVCQQHIGGDVMTHASTRFFITKRDTIDIPEMAKLLDDNYRSQRFGSTNLPCLEFILGAMAQFPVLYPEPDLENYVVFSWSRYFTGTLAKLNQMTFDEIREYIFMKCDGIHGPSDLISVPI